MTATNQPTWDPRVDPTPLPAPVPAGVLPRGGYELEAVPAGGPRMPKITTWLEVPGYEGFRFLAWVNAPARIADAMAGAAAPDGPDETTEQQEAKAKTRAAAVKAALRQVLIQHNGWCDDEGNPLPDAQDDGFLDALSMHLFHSAIAAIGEAQRTPLARPNARR